MANKVVVMQNAHTSMHAPRRGWGRAWGARGFHFTSQLCCLLWETRADLGNTSTVPFPRDPPGSSWRELAQRGAQGRSSSPAGEVVCRQEPCPQLGAITLLQSSSLCSCRSPAPCTHLGALCSALLHPLLGDEVFTLSAHSLPARSVPMSPT